MFLNCKIEKEPFSPIYSGNIDFIKMLNCLIYINLLYNYQVHAFRSNVKVLLLVTCIISN